LTVRSVGRDRLAVVARAIGFRLIVAAVLSFLEK
jgi:hypothetical protein